MKTEYDCVELVLTCGSWQEAQRIVDRLLKKKLIAGAEFLPVKSRFAWHNKLEEAEEVKLIMFSLAAYSAKVEAEVKKLHSYETFALKAIPVAYVSKLAATWLKEVTAS